MCDFKKERYIGDVFTLMVFSQKSLWYLLDQSHVGESIIAYKFKGITLSGQTLSPHDDVFCLFPLMLLRQGHDPEPDRKDQPKEKKNRTSRCCSPRVSRDTTHGLLSDLYIGVDMFSVVSVTKSMGQQKAIIRRVC